MYQLLWIVYQFMVIQVKNYKITKSVHDYKFPGICYAIQYSNLDESDKNRLSNYIENHKTFSLFIRKIYFKTFNYSSIEQYYWKPFWLLPRKWYLIRHIFYCWLVYQFKKL